MKISVTFRNMDSSGALKRYVNEKLSKLKKFLAEPTDIHIVLSVEKVRHLAEIIINTRGTTLRGRESTMDMYSAIDLVIEKLSSQLRRHHEKNKDKVRK